MYPEELEKLDDERVPYIDTWFWQISSLNVFFFFCVGKLNLFDVILFLYISLLLPFVA